MILCVDVCIRIIDLFIVFLCRDAVSMCLFFMIFVCWICVVVALNGPYWFLLHLGFGSCWFWDFDGDDFVVSWKTVIL